MSRTGRLKVERDEGWYHLYAKVAGEGSFRPLQERLCARRMVELIKHYSKGYYCRVSAYCIMGNHYHLVAHFEKPRELTRDELEKKFRHFYPNSKDLMELWGEQQWERFNERLFDVSEYMRNIQMSFTRWYNARKGRKGRLWAERFKSNVLEGPLAVLTCMQYIELNPIRAGLCERPEQWKASSFCLRNMGLDKWLIPLREFMFSERKPEALREYKQWLYHRGTTPAKQHGKEIPEHILEWEEKHNFKTRGIYLKRLRYFTDGVVLGGEERVQSWLDELREKQWYRRRKHPIPHAGELLMSLREQRSHFVEI